LTSQQNNEIVFGLVFLASEVSSTLIVMVAPLLFLSFLRFISVVLQKNSESEINNQTKGVHMLTKIQSRVKNCAVGYFACLFETVWAAMVAVSVTVTATGNGQGNLALAKNIISII
jgi:hypothetical protein